MMLKSMPVAPRPLPGEAVRSWVSRVGARYDLAPSELLAQLQDGNGVEHLRLWALDWQEDAEMEALLARASRLEVAQIRALRLLSGSWPDPAGWHRWVLAWCPACVRDDIGRYGESYERAAWRLGFHVVCPEHHAILVTACPGCSSYQARFGRRAGRQRLICDFCRGPVEAAGAPATAKRHAGEVAPSYDVVLSAPALALQADLLRAAMGTPPTSLCWPDVPSGSYAAIVRTLAALLLRPWRHDARSSCSEADIGWTHRCGLADLLPRTAHEALGRIASIIAAMAGAAPRRAGEARRTEQGLASAANDLAGLVRWLSADEQAALRAAAADWGPALAHAVEAAVQTEQSDRRSAAATAEYARQEAAWTRHAAKRYVADARRRTGARVARSRAAAAAQQRQLRVGVSGLVAS